MLAVPDWKADWKAESQRGALARTNGCNNNGSDKQSGDKPSWMFKEESNKEEAKHIDSKKNPAQLKKNDNHATQEVKIQEGTKEGKCVARPVLARDQAKESDKIHLLKDKEGMSSVDKSNIENLQKKDSTLKKGLDRV